MKGTPEQREKAIYVPVQTSLHFLFEKKVKALSPEVFFVNKREKIQGPNGCLDYLIYAPDQYHIEIIDMAFHTWVYNKEAQRYYSGTQEFEEYHKKRVEQHKNLNPRPTTSHQARRRCSTETKSSKYLIHPAKASTGKNGYKYANAITILR